MIQNDRNFIKAVRFADKEDKRKLKKIIEGAVEYENKNIYVEAKRKTGSNNITVLRKAIEQFELIPEYKDAAKQIENLVTRIQKYEKEEELERENARKEKIYQEAIEMANSRNISVLESAIFKFETVPDYRDSAQKMEVMVKRIEEIKAIKKAEQLKLKQQERIGIILMLVFCVILIFIFVVNIW